MRQSLAAGKAELDTTAFPVVVLRETAVLTDRERDEVEAALDRILDERPRHTLVLDLSDGCALPESQRESVAARADERTPVLYEKRAALAVVVRPPLLNHVPLAAYWLRVSPVPAKVFTNLGEAMAWGHAHATRTRTGEIATVTSLVGRTAR